MDKEKYHIIWNQIILYIDQQIQLTYFSSGGQGAWFYNKC